MGNAQHRQFTILTNVPIGVYYWSVQSVNNSFIGSSWAPEQTFVVTNCLPLVTTLPAGDILCCSALLNGLVTPGELPTHVWFEWGTSTDFGNSSAEILISNGLNPKIAQAGLTSLQPLTT